MRTPLQEEGWLCGGLYKRREGRREGFLRGGGALYEEREDAAEVLLLLLLLPVPWPMQKTMSWGCCCHRCHDDPNPNCHRCHDDSNPKHAASHSPHTLATLGHTPARARGS